MCLQYVKGTDGRRRAAPYLKIRLQKLKHAVQSQSRQIAKETVQNLNLEIEPDAMELMSELCWKKLVNYAGDLEAFSGHGKRSTINQDDVKLLVRNNDSLKEMVDAKMQTMKENKGSTSEANPGGERKRKNSNLS